MITLPYPDDNVQHRGPGGSDRENPRYHLRASLFARLVREDMWSAILMGRHGLLEAQ